MKKNFFKLLLLGAFTLSLGFVAVGCQDGPTQDEFDDLCKVIDGLKLDIDQIKAELGADGKFVLSVTQKPGADNVLIVEYTDGDKKELTIPTNDGTGGGSSITEGDNGHWYFDGVDTGIPVEFSYTDPDHDHGSVYPPKINATTGYWQFADANGNYTDSKYYASGAYYTVDAEDVITLYVVNKATGLLTPIPLAKNENAQLPSGIASIEILGWMKGYSTKLADGISLSTEVYGKTPTDAVSGTAGDPLVVDYSFIDHFELDSDATTTSTLAPASATYTWGMPQGGKNAVSKGTATNTLGADGTGLLVQVYPANASVADVKFAVASATGGLLPIAWGTPVQVNVELTRAAGSALWFIPGGYDSTVYGTQVQYINMFKNNSVYSLIWDETNGRSSYTEFTFQSAPVGSTEGVVKNLTTGTTDSPDGDYKVYPATKYFVEFPEGALSGTPTVDGPTPVAAATVATATSDAVVDYYLEVSEFDKKLFGIVLSDNNQAFTVTTLPDVVTLTDFTLTVWKLGVDGKVYKENITIDPQRVLAETTIPYNNTVDQNGSKDGTNKYTITDAKVTGESVSGPMTYNFTKMFDDLRAIHFSGTPGQPNYLTMEDFYKDPNRGAKLQSIVSVTYGTPATDVTSTFPAAVTGDNDPVVFQGWTGLNGTGTKTDKLNEIQSLTVTPRYATTSSGTPATATFVINQEYTVKFDVTDQSGTHINYVYLTFTPVIPSLNESLYVKQDLFWKNNILEAYYRDPLTWNTGEAPRKEIYDVAPLGFGDGGFESFADGVTFEIVAPTAINTVTPITSLVTYTQSTGVATPSEDMIFELLNQYGRTVTVDEVADNIDYNADGVLTTGTTAPYDVLAQLNPTSALLSATAQANAYGKVLTVAPTAAYNYLGTYAYSAADRAAAGFQIKIMSALYEGTIGPKNGAISLIPSFSGKEADTSAKLNDTHIGGHTYNSAVAYSLFQVWDPAANGGTGGAVYKYTYIDKVEFFVDYKDQGKYFIEDETGAASTVAVLPTATDASYVRIVPNNSTNAGTVNIIVRVSDRFGKVKQATVPISIAAAQ